MQLIGSVGNYFTPARCRMIKEGFTICSILFWHKLVHYFYRQMTKLTGRILEPPSLEYRELGKKRNLVTINKANPGSWRQDKNQYLDGCKVLTLKE